MTVRRQPGLYVNGARSYLYVYGVTGGKCGSVNGRDTLSREQCQAAATAAGLGTIGDTPANQNFPHGCFKCTSCSGANHNKVMHF